MHYTLKAGISIAVGIGAVVGMVASASTLADIICGCLVAFALLVFIRAILSLASDSGEQAAPPPAELSSPSHERSAASHP